MHGPDQVDSWNKTEREQVEQQTIPVFVFRHGRTKYLERENVRLNGKWKPEIDDLTELGKTEVLESAREVAEQINPTSDIVFFISSPRARALTTQKVIREYLETQNITVSPKVIVTERLRSGGDNAPIVGLDNQVVNKDGSEYNLDKIDDEGSEPTIGARFKTILRMFATIDKESFDSGIHNHQLFQGKRPVFILITHGEVLHAQGVPNEDYQQSFLGATFPDKKIVKLSRGRVMKLEFDLRNPGDVTVSLPNGADNNQSEVAKIHYDTKTGSVIPLDQTA